MSELENHCFKPGQCQNPEGASIHTCPTGRMLDRYIATAPMLPAESLCINGLYAHRESRSSSRLVDSYASICYDLDKALALPGVESMGLKQSLMMQITQILASTNSRGNFIDEQNPAESMQLSRLGIFMPAYQARLRGGKPNSGLIDQTHRGLCAHIEFLESQMHHRGNGNALKKQIGAHKAECEVMALLTRYRSAEFFPYPALAREEASHARSQYNHDFYTLSGGKKHAVQVKTSSNGAGYQGVAVIQHYGILQELKREPKKIKNSWIPPRDHGDYEWPPQFNYEQVLSGETPDPLARLLIEEWRNGKTLPREKSNALALASVYVSSQLR